MIRNRQARRVGLALAASLLAVGCRDGAGPKAADVTGFVTAVSGQALSLADRLVPLSPGQVDRVVDAGSAPVFIERADGSVDRGTLADIHVGSRLRVWTGGVERRSLPPQYTATRVDVVYATQR